MPGRSPIKRARRPLYIGPWLTFGIGSAIPWRETRMPVGGPVGNFCRFSGAALIAGSESGRGSATHRADPVTLPSMVQRDQRNHFPPPVLTGLVPLDSQRVRCPSHPSVHNTYYPIRQ